MCGERVKPGATATRCDEDKHKTRRKERNLYCHDCGKKL
jgi:hypothetical protein